MLSINKLSYFGKLQKLLIITAFTFLGFEEAHLHFKGCIFFFHLLYFFPHLFSPYFWQVTKLPIMTNDVFHNGSYADSYVL